jgi:transcriptional regulator with GAF, ATPase, and Fis domain
VNEKPLADIVKDLSLAFCAPNAAALMKQPLTGLLKNLMERLPSEKGVLILRKDDGTLEPAHWFNSENPDEKRARWEMSKSLADYACETKAIVRVNAPAEEIKERFPTAGTHGATWILVAPLFDGKRVLGAFELFDRKRDGPAFTDADMTVAGIHALSIALHLAQRRRDAGDYRDEGEATGLARLLGDSQAMKRTKQLVETFGPTDRSILILGESGTGKELIARALHETSRRSGLPYLAVNATAWSSTLIEAELFGHVKGAFTGAVDGKAGIFERVRGGTVFLDEVGDASPEAQAKLLRVLEEKTVTRLGGTEPIEVDFRLVAATNKDLEALSKKGTFREDLYFRLGATVIRTPPLRERADDIELLARHFAEVQANDMGLPFAGFTPGAIAYLKKQPWRGNVRQLKNVAGEAFVLAKGPIDKKHIALGDAEEKTPPTPEQIADALRKNKNNISRAMAFLGRDRKWYYKYEDVVKALLKGG